MEKNIRVVVRVRPFNSKELENQMQRNLIQVVDRKTLIFDPDIEEDEFFYQGTKQSYRDITKRVNKKLSMNFDDVFNEEANNHEVFESSMKPLIESVMNGFNGSVFVYGATGAGKTYTMLGNENHRGITFLTIKELFDQMEQLKESRKFDIGISYLEVYNERVMNLLTKSGPLKLREDCNGVVVGGLVLTKIQKADELFDLLVLGNRNRTQHPTDANAESSRSHAIFQVHLRMTDLRTTEKRTVKLSMIDLAGSERAASTKCMGLRFKEGASINKSLLALGNCINNLADGLKHIPYRDSNLTRILKDSLGGNCQTAMIANVSPSSLTYEDTYNTLKYASRAKNIRTTIKQNVVKANMPKEYYVKKINEQQIENDKLKMLVKQLETRLASQSGQSVAAAAPQVEAKKESTAMLYDSGEVEEWYAKIDLLYGALLSAQQNFLSIQSKDKVLKFRSTLKQNAEFGAKILQLDGKNLSADIAKLEMSIGKYEKESSRQNEDMLRWKKRYFKANKDLEVLRNEVKNNKYSKLLTIYMKNKDCELELSKSASKEKHIRKVNGIYSSETDNITRMLPICYDLIQEYFILARGRNEVDYSMQEKLQSLVKLVQGQRSVKFDLVDDINPNETDLEILRLHLEDNDMIAAESDPQSCGLKRLKPRSFDFDTEKAIAEKRPNNIVNASGDGFGLSSIATVNEMVDGVSALGNDNLNSTFQVPIQNKIDAVALQRNALLEKNILNSKGLAIGKKIVRHPSKKITDLKKATLMKCKENKKFSPNRIRKSPRPINRGNAAAFNAKESSPYHRNLAIKKNFPKTPEYVLANTCITSCVFRCFLKIKELKLERRRELHRTRKIVEIKN